MKLFSLGYESHDRVLFLLFFDHTAACRILNLNLCPLQWKSVQSLNHWTTREVL